MEMDPIINGGIAFAAVLILMVLNIPIGIGMFNTISIKTAAKAIPPLMIGPISIKYLPLWSLFEIIL